MTNMTLSSSATSLQWLAKPRASLAQYCTSGAEATDAPREVVKKALAHLNPNHVETGLHCELVVRAATGAGGDMERLPVEKEARQGLTRHGLERKIPVVLLGSESFCSAR